MDSAFSLTFALLFFGLRLTLDLAFFFAIHNEKIELKVT